MSDLPQCALIVVVLIISLIYAPSFLRRRDGWRTSRIGRADSCRVSAKRG